MGYYVNIDKPTWRVKIHKTTCVHAQIREKSRENGGWSKLYPTYQEANAHAIVHHGDAQKVNCQVCHPELD